MDGNRNQNPFMDDDISPPGGFMMDVFGDNMDNNPFGGDFPEPPPATDEKVLNMQLS